MTNRNALLGRSRPREKLTREEIAALDEATVPPVPPAKPPGASRFLHSDVVGRRNERSFTLPRPTTHPPLPASPPWASGSSLTL